MGDSTAKAKGQHSHLSPHRCDTANLKEIKFMCDDEVEHVLSAGARSVNGYDHLTPELRHGGEVSIQFVPFNQSHTIEDICMLLALTGSVAVIAAVAYGFVANLPWQEARLIYAVSVGFFSICALAHTAIKYSVGPLIFVGTRSMPGTGNTEEIRVWSHPLKLPPKDHKHTLEYKGELIAPMYSLDIKYTRKNGSEVIMEKQQNIDIGHINEWIRESGDFCVHHFGRRLLIAMDRAKRNMARHSRADKTGGWGFGKSQHLEVLHAPKGHDLCSTCTKQFCVDNAEGCRGAQIVESNDDTSTGFEGQVWAKCFVRDPTKDQSIVSLYLLCVVVLLCWAFLRSNRGTALLDTVSRAVRRSLGR
ncbi:hypothetical protein MCUN1_003297 [Malassezia cuniculi]|uniref:Signal peptidase complex subunit 2 n=1 Tax=Malassezia cuniculi TaxID=948313 RepID=A0AAF0J7N0_9BASI|nr:hypothetical protein MCUN1_003297 [Malassezia cuniculi]